MPAPVKAMKCLLSLICFTSVAAFLSIALAASRRSFAATFGALSAMPAAHWVMKEDFEMWTKIS